MRLRPNHKALRLNFKIKGIYFRLLQLRRRFCLIWKQGIKPIKYAMTKGNLIQNKNWNFSEHSYPSSKKKDLSSERQKIELQRSTISLPNNYKWKSKNARLIFTTWRPWSRKNFNCLTPTKKDRQICIKSQKGQSKIRMAMRRIGEVFS